MLRPEQLQVAEIGRLDAPGDGCIGTVAEVDFTGHACTLAVVPIDEAETGAWEPVLVRCPIIEAPPVGAAVRITVRGPAHVLADVSVDPRSSAEKEARSG